MSLSQELALDLGSVKVAVVIHGEAKGAKEVAPDYTFARLGQHVRRTVSSAVGQELVRSQVILDADVAFIDSRTGLGIAQVVCAHASDPGDTNVIAYVGGDESEEDFVAPPGVPFCNIEKSIARLRTHILAHFEAVAKTVPLYGLVLAGGKSTRMNRDKASLTYHGKPQVEHCYDLLSGFCAKVFVSNRVEQANDTGQGAFPQIHDTFLDMGPLGGILSAQRAHPHAAWLALACDLPFVDESAIETLLKGRNPYKLATAFISERDGLPEPLCAVYEPKSVFRLLHFLGLGYNCPRKVLINSDTCLLRQPSARVMTNVNSPDEYAEACRSLAAEGSAT
ncbi:MAG: NTP transferase domain-containing protein [Candidatus Hydrogenedentes bacterium]|nr:NTP transferase domain-containing protein [Candidatus Hydrogenedentota bacterium]